MEKDNISWKAIYSDGESLMQFDADGGENKYVDINRTRLIQFLLYRDNIPAVVVHLGPHKKLIYRMRRAMNNHGEEEAVFLAGWQELRGGKSVQMISFLFEDGHVEIVDRFYEDHLWFYSINFLKEEKI
jgi:hypothetical protein